MKPEKEKIGKRMLNKGYELGKAEAIELGYKNGISEGWDKGKKEAIKQEIVFLEWLKDFLYREEIECFPIPLLDRIEKLKSELRELAK